MRNTMCGKRPKWVTVTLNAWHLRDLRRVAVIICQGRYNQCQYKQRMGWAKRFRRRQYGQVLSYIPVLILGKINRSFLMLILIFFDLKIFNWSWYFKPVFSTMNILNHKILPLLTILIVIIIEKQSTVLHTSNSYSLITLNYNPCIINFINIIIRFLYIVILLLLSSLYMMCARVGPVDDAIGRLTVIDHWDQQTCHHPSWCFTINIDICQFGWHRPTLVYAHCMSACPVREIPPL